MVCTEKMVKNIIGDDDDMLEDTLKKQFDIKGDCDSEDRCKLKMRRMKRWK